MRRSEVRSVRERQTRKQSNRSWRRYTLYSVALLAGLFIVANATMWGMYRSKILPNYQLGTAKVGGMPVAELNRQLSGDKLLPAELTLQAGTDTKRYTPAALGVHADAQASITALKASRPLFPLLSVVTRHTVPLHMTMNEQAFAAGSGKVSEAFNKSTTPSHVIFDGQAFTVATPAAGRAVETTKLKALLLSKVAKGSSVITLPISVVPAPAASDLSGEVSVLQKQVAVSVSFVLKGKTTTPSVADKAKWFAAEGQTMVLSGDALGAYLDGVSPQAANRSDITLAVRYALSKAQTATLALVPAGSATRTYCTATRGVSTAALNELTSKLALTYADTRGWNASGKLAFKHVDTGCDYTVWLSAANQMTSFGSICDDYYNCQAGNNVVVNNERWLHATDPWNAAGGGIEDYRTLIINHETGHRLGFYDNPTCTAPGGPAPVMMQQSINLDGCTFNRWPTAVELAAMLSANGV